MPENSIQIDQHMPGTRLDRLVTQKVTEILNAILDTEADEIAGASRYERSGGKEGVARGPLQARDHRQGRAGPPWRWKGGGSGRPPGACARA